MEAKIYAITEMLGIHAFMDSADLSDRGKKIFSEIKNISFKINSPEKVNQQKFVDLVKNLFYKRPENPMGKPVFIIAFIETDLQDKKGIYYLFCRQDVNQCSTGETYFILSDYIKSIGLCPIENQNRTIEKIGIANDLKFAELKMDTLENFNF